MRRSRTRRRGRHIHRRGEGVHGHRPEGVHAPRRLPRLRLARPHRHNGGRVEDNLPNMRRHPTPNPPHPIRPTPPPRTKRRKIRTHQERQTRLQPPPRHTRRQSVALALASTPRTPRPPPRPPQSNYDDPKRVTPRSTAHRGPTENNEESRAMAHPQAKPPHRQSPGKDTQPTHPALPHRDPITHPRTTQQKRTTTHEAHQKIAYMITPGPRIEPRPPKRLPRETTQPTNHHRDEKTR